MQNRRQSIRVTPAAESKLTVQVFDLTFKAKLKNISSGGAFFSAGVLFPVGAVIKAYLDFAGISMINPARVVRRDQHRDGVAIMFIKPSKQFVMLVNEYNNIPAYIDSDQIAPSII